MGHLIDTNVAIYLRDRTPEIIDRINALPSGPVMSIVSRVELENGVYARPEITKRRRRSLDILLETLLVLDFNKDSVEAYRGIVAACGYSRRRILDRMIAATAIAHSLTLITLNAADFHDIPGLKLDAW